MDFLRCTGKRLNSYRPKASSDTAAGPRTANGDLAACPLEAGYSMLMIWLSIAHAIENVASASLP